ncbi:MAG: LptF/LptG family permease, partial [Saprospiraceae bacterium]|nr:LptF/LptG family permease [Saprospiraceae bacterium]
MKKVDRLLLTSFVGPFVVSFGIALFVLVMQFLWLYIDEIAGKGVSVFILLELIGYLSISTFPMALPIAVLIASVMVMGNLAERYELSSLKSAGISLLRIMRSLIVVAAAIGFFSYICSDFLIPMANLKFKSRLYDIRKQKPALTLEEGIFNEDFRQFVIRIGGKARDGETITDVLIEDQTNSGRLKFNQILADSGQMFTTRDKRYFVMNLFHGAQYQEPSPQGATEGQRYPFVRTNFESWSKVWDLGEFEMNRTDEDRFKSQRSMLSMNQLRKNVDSLYREVQETRDGVADDLAANLIRLAKQLETDSLAANRARQATADSLARTKLPVQQKPIGIPIPATRPAPVVKGPDLPQQVLKKPLREYASLEETFPDSMRAPLLKNALIQSRSNQVMLERRIAQIDSRRKEAIKTGYELYTKYSFALVCFIFLFIGAPMGAIIRKGGFGYPILVSIIFFVTFIMLTIMCRKLAEAYVLSAFWAAMAPSVALVPIGFFLTRRALNDAQMFSTDRLDRWL